MSDEPVPDAGYDDFLDAVADDEGYYLACPNDHGWLPPRRACPICGETDLAETALPDHGEVTTFTVVHVPIPSFEDDAPYVTAIAEFGGVRVTGILLEDPGDVTRGRTVRVDVDTRETTEDRLLVFRPR